MTLFRDVPAANPARSSASRRRTAGWWLVSTGVVGALILSLVPSPYAIERPGPVFDILGEVTIDGDTDEPDEVPLISIPGEQTYPTEGTLSMLTVNVVGNREERPSWVEVVTAWGDPSKAVVPLDAVYPEGETLEQSNEQSALDMENSQKDAIAAALTELGFDLSSTLTVAGFSPESPSEDVLAVGDQIVSVNGRIPVDVPELRAIIAENGADSPATVEVLRDGSRRSVEVTPVLSTQAGATDAPILGISVGADYDFPFDVQIQLENVGGPSAGMMFALGIIDKLTPGALTGGKDIAGTGTIGAEGAVGPIGGIRQKMYGATGAGAEYFLAPSDNCDEVVGHIPDGLTVFSVTTLDDSLAVLAALREGGDTAALPSCPAS